MKPVGNFLSEKLLLLLLSLFLPVLVFTQVYSKSKSNNVLKNWAFEGQAGIFSYFGDLSIYDGDIVNKLIEESGPAGGLALTKYFGNYFGVSGEMIFGQIKATKNSTKFESNILEFNAQVQFDLIKLIFYQRTSNFALLLSGGIGNIFFNSTLNTGSESEDYSTEVPEFIYFFGGRLEYHLSKTLKLGAGISIKQLQNDKLDVTVKNSNYDYYSYVNIAVAYKLNRKTQRRGGSKLNSIKKRKKRKR